MLWYLSFSLRGTSASRPLRYRAAWGANCKDPCVNGAVNQPALRALGSRSAPVLGCAEPAFWNIIYPCTQFVSPAPLLWLRRFFSL
jgi:hypothetical protein